MVSVFLILVGAGADCWIMGEIGWEGARYGSKHKATMGLETHARYPDRADRNFHAPVPNRW